MKSINPSQTAAWRALEQHFSQMKETHMRDLFKQDNDRFHKFSATFGDQILVDYSKNRITEETLDKLLALAEETALKSAIESMFSGEKLTVRKTVPFYILRYATATTRLSMLMAKM